MIIDGFLQFDSASNVLTTNTTSANVIDLQNSMDWGIGDDPALKVMVVMTTRLTSSSTASTLQVQVVGSSSATLASATVYAQSGTYSALQLDQLLTFQRPFDIDLPRARGALPRYIGLNYVIGGPVALTAAAVSAFLVLDRDDIVLNYPPGVVITN